MLLWIIWLWIVRLFVNLVLCFKLVDTILLMKIFFIRRLDLCFHIKYKYYNNENLIEITFFYELNLYEPSSSQISLFKMALNLLIYLFISMIMFIRLITVKIV